MGETSYAQQYGWRRRLTARLSRDVGPFTEKEVENGGHMEIL
jgi:hypothetical protein